jgi:hypothetical protein
VVAEAGSSRSNTASGAVAVALVSWEVTRGVAEESSEPAAPGALSARVGLQPARIRTPMAATGRMRMKFSKKRRLYPKPYQKMSVDQ